MPAGPRSALCGTMTYMFVDRFIRPGSAIGVPGETRTDCADFSRSTRVLAWSPNVAELSDDVHLRTLPGGTGPRIPGVPKMGPDYTHWHGMYDVSKHF